MPEEKRVNFGTLDVPSYFEFEAREYVRVQEIHCHKFRDDISINAVGLSDGKLTWFNDDVEVTPIEMMNVTGLPCDQFGRCTAT